MIPRTVKRMFEHRAEPRIEPDVDHAVLEHRGGRHPVRLLNLSCSGAMVTFETTPHIGERVQLELLGREPVKGFVRWVRDDRMGVNFEVPLT
ncbi:MAG: PilZ domain-containing protein [Pseudomonadota bacterium]|nr:PilZ domain-containing protein [Pseudomonadota bacterium]